MSAPDLALEAALAGAYPSTRFNQRERKLLESVKDYVDSVTGSGDVTLADLAPGIAPSHVVKFAGKHTTVGGAAAEAITVTGVLATDIVLVTVQSNADTLKVLLSAAPTTNTITLTFNDDPETDFVVSYSVLRAAV